MSLRVNTREIERRVKAKYGSIRASDFRPEVEKSFKRVIRTCIDKTPIRGEDRIRAAQKKQYHNRITYIPSVHELIDPTLIVKDTGEEWLYSGGRWYAATYHDLPSDVDAIYQDLMNERDRRLQTSESDFIAHRAQARFLYRKSWWEVPQSAGVQISIDSRITSAITRRSPAQKPAKGYAQWRGGKGTLSVVVFNPFLDQESRYKPFSGKDILARAIQADKPRLDSDVAKKLAELVR